jgi:hypothetical protein
MNGLAAFVESIFGSNATLTKDHKKLVSAIKDGACSVSEAPSKAASRSAKRSDK